MKVVSLLKTVNLMDYDPFGMLLEGRNWQVGSEYRYGFNTQEQDDEVYGNGNLNSAEFWEYDTRLGRRWNRDPIVEPEISPYTVFLNNPIILVDYNGDKVDYSGETKREKRKTARLVRKAARRDPEFAKKHSDRQDDTQNTFVFDWEKSNSTSVNSKQETVVRAGQDPETQDGYKDRFYIEFGTIDPKYDIYRYREVVDYYVPIWIEPYSQQIWTESIVAYEIAPSDFAFWRQTILTSSGVSGQIQADGPLTRNVVNVTFTLSWVPNGDIGGHKYTVHYLGMSVPLYMKVPRKFLWRHDWKMAQYRYTLKETDKPISTRNPKYNVVGGNTEWYKSGGSY